jgi:dephospho-CoA kinase
MAAQADDAARRGGADVWLDNAGPEDDVLTAVDRLWHTRLLPFHGNLLAGRCAIPPEAVAPGQPADLGVRRRLLDRVRWACGATVAGHWDDDATLQLALPRIPATLGGTDRQEVRRALGRAGFPPCGTHLHGSADPGTPVRIRLADD